MKPAIDPAVEVEGLRLSATVFGDARMRGMGGANGQPDIALRIAALRYAISVWMGRCGVSALGPIEEMLAELHKLDDAEARLLRARFVDLPVRR